jgi:hypothetical protein
MVRDPSANQSYVSRWGLVLAVIAGGLTAAQSGRAQPPAAPPRPAEPEVVPAYARSILNGTDVADPNVVQAGCATCGGGRGSPVPNLLEPSGGFGGGCACVTDTCDSCACKPGRSRYCPIDDCSDSCCSRLFGGLARCICCPDPCYEPVWSTTANAAFFMDTVRPKTYTRFRWDAGRNLTQPDRVEFFWARVGAAGGSRGPRLAEGSIDYDELSLYQETAAGAFAFFIETPYRSIYPEFNDHHANFGDLNLGTKTMFVDCELMQCTFQFKTYLPTGRSRNGLGTGHTSLEPSLLTSIKLMPGTYYQGQLAYWIPVGGDGTYQGATWHYHSSLNRSLYKRGALELIGTAEFNGWTFTDGAVTDFVTPDMGVTTPASGESYFTVGGGLRLVFCEFIDFGFGFARAITDDHFARELYRTEFRLRY